MDKINKYVERFFSATKMNSRYDMSFSEIDHGIEEVFRSTDVNGVFKIIIIFFNFGYAKGYRAALAEMKKGGAA